MSKVHSKDGTAIAFERSGAGPSIILVDGAFCSRRFGPMPQLAPLLTQRFTVFTYDRRGRNESGDTAPYAVEREVEDLAALIAEAGGSTLVYGTSSGTALALHATTRLSTITKLALYEPPYVLDTSRPAVPSDYIDQFKAMLASGRRGDMVAYFMTTGVGLPAEAVAAMRAMPMWPALEAVAHTLIYDAMCMGNFTLPPDLTKQMAARKVAALVMGGGASPEWLHHAVQAVAAGIPGAQLRMLEGQTHEVAVDALAPELNRFFAA